MELNFTKMHGCGNDFVILDYDEFKKSGLEMDVVAKKLCDRNFGVGADGLIIPNLTTQEADIGWFFYNSVSYFSKLFNTYQCFSRRMKWQSLQLLVRA